MKTAIIIGVGAVALYALWKAGQPAASPPYAGTSAPVDTNAYLRSLPTVGSSPITGAVPQPAAITAPTPGNFLQQLAQRAQVLVATARGSAPAPDPTRGQLSSPLRLSVKGQWGTGPIT